MGGQWVDWKTQSSSLSKQWEIGEIGQGGAQAPRWKKIVKDVMETWSCEYGFILSGWIIDIMDLSRQPVW